MSRQAKLPAGGNKPASLDLRIFDFLRTRGHQRPLELLVTAFSLTGNNGLFWLGLALSMWIGGDPPGIFLIMPLVLYPTLLINFVIKSMLGRERPYVNNGVRPLVHIQKTKSFPSSHAAMSFAAAIYLSLFHPSWWPVFFGLALLMSWSRVYVGVHYPSDVLGGTAVGLVIGGIILWLIT
jgi:undecaprenyl-diphosphatase